MRRLRFGYCGDDSGIKSALVCFFERRLFWWSIWVEDPGVRNPDGERERMRHGRARPDWHQDGDHPATEPGEEGWAGDGDRRLGSLSRVERGGKTQSLEIKINSRGKSMGKSTTLIVPGKKTTGKYKPNCHWFKSIIQNGSPCLQKKIPQGRLRSWHWQIISHSAFEEILQGRFMCQSEKKRDRILRNSRLGVWDEENYPPVCTKLLAPWASGRVACGLVPNLPTASATSWKWYFSS